MKTRISHYWSAMSIQKRVLALVTAVFSLVMLSFLFNLTLVHFFINDFQGILSEDDKCSRLIRCLEEESALFEEVIKQTSGSSMADLEAAIKETQETVGDLTFSYEMLGDRRYAFTRAIRNTFETYEARRDAVLAMPESDLDYIKKLYAVYDLQSYLKKYAESLMLETIGSGSRQYREKADRLIYIPVGVCLLAFVVAGGLFLILKIMNSSVIRPITEEKGRALDLLREEENVRLETERRLEVTKFELLQNQIRPHFLFNTLNTIAGMANLEEAENTEKMIRALGALFRYNLHTKDTKVALSRELKVVRDYLYLQQMRFGNRLRFEIRCEVDEETVMVPSFILQPLAENSVRHGLAPKEDGGEVRIGIRNAGRYLEIRVADTGIGMDEGALQALLARMETGDTEESGIGLSNIYRRVQSMYRDAEMAISSRPGEGTCVVMRFPLIEERGEGLNDDRSEDGSVTGRSTEQGDLKG